MRPSTERPLRVLARPKTTSRKDNPYTSLLYAEVERAGIEVVEYKPYLAPFGPWDVVHVHWPESVFDHTLIEAIPTTESLLLSARLARARGAKLLWTIHNLHTHEERHAAREASFMRRFTRELDGVVALTPAGLSAARARFPALAERRAWIVPHPHYRGQYLDQIDRREARRRLSLAPAAKVMLVFGRMYEYKNVPELIRAVRAAPHEDWTVLVVGKPRTREVGWALRQEGAGDPRVRYYLEYIPEDDAQLYFRAADLVVQPYREILNSGTALLALSFDRPVLLPRHGAGVDLVADLGRPWVDAYDGVLDWPALEAALAAAATLPERTLGEHTRSIDVTEIGAKMARAFRELAARTGAEVGLVSARPR